MSIPVVEAMRKDLLKAGSVQADETTVAERITKRTYGSTASPARASLIALSVTRMSMADGVSVPCVLAIEMRSFASANSGL
jgi:hypothetical protein